MLRAAFEPFGKVVHVAVITEQGTNLPRGFGFVHMPEASEAKMAREAMDGMVRRPWGCCVLEHGAVYWGMVQ